MLFFVDESNLKLCEFGHARFMHQTFEVPIEVQVASAVQAVKENPILQGLRESLIPREYVNIR